MFFWEGSDGVVYKLSMDTSISTIASWQSIQLVLVSLPVVDSVH